VHLCCGVFPEAQQGAARGISWNDRRTAIGVAGGEKSKATAGGREARRYRVKSKTTSGWDATVVAAPP
jgi:hypothetical protein